MGLPEWSLNFELEAPDQQSASAAPLPAKQDEPNTEDGAAPGGSPAQPCPHTHSSAHIPVAVPEVQTHSRARLSSGGGHVCPLQFAA